MREHLSRACLCDLYVSRLSAVSGRYIKPYEEISNCGLILTNVYYGGFVLACYPAQLCFT